MKSIHYIIIIIALVISIFFLTYCGKEKDIDNNINNNNNIITKVDTIYKDKFVLKRDTVKEFVLQPTKVIIYTKTDTLYRKDLEKGPIISNVDITPDRHEVDVTRVDTAGHVTTTKYKIPDGIGIVSIRPNETVVKKKTKMGRFFASVGRFFKKGGSWLVIVGAGVAGYYVGKN